MRHTFTLANGVEIPAVGFGTYKAADNQDERIISEAIRQGYRHLDTAAFYFNEEAVGKAVRESGIPREEFFITSKVWRDRLGYEAALEEFETSLKKLGTDYLDLYLIHWPRPFDLNAEWKDLDVETWKALEELYRAEAGPHMAGFLAEKLRITEEQARKLHLNMLIYTIGIGAIFAMTTPGIPASEIFEQQEEAYRAFWELMQKENPQ